MNFYEATYSGVAFWQIAGGWGLVGLWVVVKIVRWFFKDTYSKYNDGESYWQHPEREITGREYKALVSPYIFERDKAISSWNEERTRHERDLKALLASGLENGRLIEKVKSLEARIEKITIRPRQQNGRFKKKEAP